MQIQVYNQLKNIELMKAFEEFKTRILANLNKVNIDFEVGHCTKHLYFDDEDNYWHNCYCFLKGIAHYLGIETLR